jgi:transcriptional regulator with XRE-family HTH domain
MTKATLLKRIGEQIAALRQEQGLSQSDLARLAGKDRQSIHKVEKGQMNASVFYLSEIATALKTTIADIVNIE